MPVKRWNAIQASNSQPVQEASSCMNYDRIYSEFIADRLTKQPVKPDYFEKHHILPRSLGGGNEKSNIVRLSIEDHIHAHILLAKIYGGSMWGAALMMTKKTIGRTRSVKRIPTKDEIRAAAFARKMFSKNIRGESHPMFGKKMSDENKKIVSDTGKARAAAGLMWSQQNKHLISGENSWLRKPENADAKAKAMPKIMANLAKACAANLGDGNVMHRPEVKQKMREIQKQHWVNGTGAGSLEASAKRKASHRSDEYLDSARLRVLGDKNPMFGMGGSLNPNSRSVICIETGEVFKSVKDAVSFCGGDVTKASRTGGKAGGYSWARLGAHSADNRVMKNEKSQPRQTF